MSNARLSFTAVCVPVSEWPVACRYAWGEAHQQSELFDDPKPALVWRSATRTKVCKGFGAWLSWRGDCGVLDQHDGPETGVTPDTVKTYYDTLIATRAPLTAYCRIHELFLALRVMVPDSDWSWLGKAANKARAQARNVRFKRDRMQSSERLLDLAQQLMDDADTDPDLSDYKRALMFRDGLLILFLTHRPLRLKNVAAVTLGAHIVFQGTGAILSIPADEMKSRRPYETSLPSDLVEAIDHYCQRYRTFLLLLTHQDDDATRQRNQAGLQQALWISNEGRRLDHRSLYEAIRRRTKAAFGVSMNPHLFRDVAVTHMIRHSPEAALLTKDILDHATITTTERHYNQAQMIDTSRRHADLIESLLSMSDDTITNDAVTRPVLDRNDVVSGNLVTCTDFDEAVPIVPSTKNTLTHLSHKGAL